MTSIIKFLSSLAYGNVIISLGSLSLAFMTAFILKLDYSILNAFLPWFFITFFVYSMNRFTDIEEDIINNPDRTNFFKLKSKFFLVSGIFSFIVASFISIINSITSFLLIMIPVILVVLYSIPLIPSRKGMTRLKNIFMMKNFVVALGWAVIPIYVANYMNYFSNVLLLISLFIFIRIFIGVTMFDIRDVSGDRAHGINTIPVKLGVQKSYQIINLLNVASLLTGISIIIMGGLFLQTLIVTVFTFLMGILYTWKTYNRDMIFFCNVIVDGEYVITGLLAGIITFIV